jgi:hypothetical protein
MVGAWHGHSMASVNQTWPHCVNQMGKTHSKPLAAGHDMGAEWERHAMCESAFTVPGWGYFSQNFLVYKCMHVPERYDMFGCVHWNLPH